MVKVNYSSEKCFKTDVKRAVQYYLGLHDENQSCTSEGIDYGTGFILYPQALNPFLKVMETMDEMENFMVIPVGQTLIVDQNYNSGKQFHPYLILKYPQYKYVKNIEFEGSNWSN